MTAPRVFSIPPGVPFLSTLADSLMNGRLVPDFADRGDALALSDVAIYVPTRRAARELRSIFVERMGGRSAILPSIHPLGEFDEDAEAFEADGLDDPPPVDATERVLSLAPLVRRWKKKLPAHIAAQFEEEVVVPASTADSIWLARHLADLIDEVESEGADWTKLADLADTSLANWWQVTLDFLRIVTEHWPRELEARGRIDPATHRDRMIRRAAARLRDRPPGGPVIAAGSTGSVPAVSELLSVIARLPNGAVVLPGFDGAIDELSWAALTADRPEPPSFGHPQYGLSRLIGRLGVSRDGVDDLAHPAHAAEWRARIIAEALRPAETTDVWGETRARFPVEAIDAALADVELVEAANEREEAVSAALALRRAVASGERRVALITPDRELARRVASELLRFDIVADDSGGTPLADAPPVQMARLLVEAVCRPGDPVPIAALLKHPLLRLGAERQSVRRSVERIELVALRGAPARPDLLTLDALFANRYADLDRNRRKPFWFARIDQSSARACRDVLARLVAAVEPLSILRSTQILTLQEAVTATVQALEALGRDEDGGLSSLYGGDAGERFASTLRDWLAAGDRIDFAPGEWPDVFAALIGTVMVKPAPGGDGRVSIWGTLEARLQEVDTLVLAGLNEGTWPGRAASDRFMSRMMKGGLALQPPERRIGLAAHDFMMAMGAPKIVLTRAARSGDAPSTPSRWLQRLTTFVGSAASDAMRSRGAELIGHARRLDDTPVEQRPAQFMRPEGRPPLERRPRDFSVTEIEKLRRDPYAVYARRVLHLDPLESLVRDPGAAERGILFHEILGRFTQARIDPDSPDALKELHAIGRQCFAELNLPADVQAIWWPRFAMLAGSADGFLTLERRRGERIAARLAEAHASYIEVGQTGARLHGYADRVDVMLDGTAEILDYKTGSNPSNVQAHTLIAPQLALEGALLMRGAFADAGKRSPSDLIYVRLRPSGQAADESVLELKNPKRSKTAIDISEEAWRRLEELLEAYRNPEQVYISRALPFKEGDTDGDYDHLARVLEWSAGAADADGAE